MKFIIYALLAVSSVQAMAKAAPPAPITAENIGVRTLELNDKKRGRPVLVELWYPTEQKEPFDEPPDPVWIHPKEIRNASIAKGHHPLIIMSHGHGGDRRDRSWLAEILVLNGFVVASVEHYGNCWRNLNPLLSLRFWERARDVKFTLDFLLADPELQKWVDAKRIGFVGYSLGGMTGLALGGAKAQNVKEIIMMQREHHDDIDLKLVEKIDFTEAHGSFLERRIKAIALLSPAAFVFPPQSLKEVKVPVALVTSEGDEVLPYKDHALKIIRHLSPTKLKLLKEKVSHYVFLNRVSEAGKGIVREDLYTDVIEADRLETHEEIGLFVAEFFKEKLR